MKRIGVTTLLSMTLLWLMLPAGGVAEAKVSTETIVYRQGETALEGYLAVPEGIGEARVPGVIVVHDWSGLGPYAKKRAEMLAEAGFVALAVDIYGQGVRPETTEERAKQAGRYRGDRALMRARAQAGLEALTKHPRVDPAKVAAIGYCFGGGVALELARSGAEVAGVVSFHGNLDTPRPEAAAQIRGSVLVCHGAADPYVPAEQVAGFHDEMRAARVDYQFVAYGGAVHSFTHPEAGSDPSQGSAYDERADRRSWQAMLRFFAEIFG